MSFLDGLFGGPEFATHVPTSVPKPEQNEAWLALCRDPRWKWSDHDNSDRIYFAEGWDQRSTDESSADNQIIIANVVTKYGEGREDVIHQGALASKFVFEARPKDEPEIQDMETYMRRLICFLCKRFVIISRPTASSDYESLTASYGLPKEGVRYWWRYWDNEGNVYQVTMEKFRDAAGTMRDSDAMSLGRPRSYRDLSDATFESGMPPGDFQPAPRNIVWMRIPAAMCASGRESTDLSKFFDHLWSFTQHGTTRVALWDASLMMFAKLAGVPEEKECRCCANHVEHALRRCSRCKLVFYCNNNYCQRDDWKDHKKMCKYFPNANKK